MSSHHFVKEGQEPALLVAGNVFNEVLLYHLLEWSPLLMVTSDALDKMLALAIKIDVVWHHSEINEAIIEKLEAQQPCEIYANVAIEQAITAITRHKNRLLHVLGWSDEEALNNIKSYGNERLIVFTEKSQWRKVTGVYEKWLSKGSKLQFHTEKEVQKLDIQNDGFYKFENASGMIVEELMIH